LGNIVLADHGLTVEDEALEPVPEANPALTRVSRTKGDRCEEPTRVSTAPRFRPRLGQAPLTHAAPDVAHEPPESATATMRTAANTALPAITLTTPGASAEAWRPRRDLLSSHPTDPEFVVESEPDGAAYLRFGDGQFGTRPAAATRFTARYRAGSGVAGNVGAMAIAHLVSDDPAIVDEVIAQVRNPLPAQGGTEPESMEEVRQNAPSAFRTQERAVTPDDYALAARRCAPDVQRAAATFRWTGSWRTVFLTVDRLGAKPVDADFEQDVRQCMERYRMAGHDLEVDGPLYVPLEIAMTVCVKRGYLSADVKSALREVFGRRISRDGRRGLFHPDNFTFGQTVFLSTFYAAAQAVAGVDSVEITTFQRQGSASDEALTSGKLTLGRLEIARLDNDPDFPERGVFNMTMRGGR
jgi:predicted phage baseplate assembly protein